MAFKPRLLERFFSPKDIILHLRQHRMARRVIKQKKRGRSLEHGFLHIPKTGGSALNDFVRALEAQGKTMPVRFGHFWRLQDISAKFPGAQVSFMIRDPLERTISGFNSRLRQGRPRNQSMWTLGEAATFSMFPSIHSFLEGMISDDDYQVSATKFAMKNVRHLRYNYRYYFGSVRAIRQNRERIHLVGEVETSQKFWIMLAAEFGVPEAAVLENYNVAHVSKLSTSEILKPYSAQQINRMRRALKPEYKIYKSLKEMARA